MAKSLGQEPWLWPSIWLSIWPNIWPWPSLLAKRSGCPVRQPKEGPGDCRRAAVGVVADAAAPRGVIYRSTHFLADFHHEISRFLLRRTTRAGMSPDDG